MMNKIRKIVWLILSVQIFAYSNFVHSDESNTKLNSVSCWFENNSSTIIDCYHFYTNETPGDNTTKTILIPIVVFKADRAPEKEDPILFLQGGPGPAYIDKDNIGWTYKNLSYEYWSRNRDLIISDYRGLGISKPSLVCEKLDEESLKAKSSDDWFSVYENCYDELKSAEINISEYHAFNIVKDLISIRKQLGIKQWNLWGKSYGGSIAMLLAELDNESIRSIIVESPSIPRFRSNKLTQIKPFISLLNKLFIECQKLWRCEKYFPSSSEEFVVLVNRLHNKPITLQIEFREQNYDVQIDDDWFLSTVYNSLYKKRNTEFLPHLVKTINEGDYEKLKSEFKSYFEDTSLPVFSYGGFISYWCIETEIADIEKLNKLDIPAWAKRRNSNPDVCQIWERENQVGLFENVKVSFDTPILFLSGELDHITPPKQTEEILSDFRNGQRFVLSEKSHILSDDFCTDILSNRFINAPYKTIAKDQCENLTENDRKALPHIFGRLN